MITTDALATRLRDDTTRCCGSGTLGSTLRITRLVILFRLHGVPRRLGVRARWLYDRFQAMRGGFPFPRKIWKCAVRRSHSNV